MPSSRLFLVLLVCASFLAVGTHATSCTVYSQRTQCGSQTCNPITLTCGACNVTSECQQSALECKSGKCVMTPLKDRFTVGVAFSAIIGFFVCAVAAVAGVGGGGVLVPVYMTLMGAPIVNAVAFSQATIAGQSCVNVLMQLGRFHPNYQPPKATRPLINWEYLCLLLPISLVGTLLGNLVGKVVPDYSRLILLFTLMTYILYRAIQRIRKQRTEDMERQRLLNDNSPSIQSPDGKKPPQPGDDTYSEPEEAEPMPPLRPQLPPLYLGYCILVFVLLCALNYIKSPKSDIVSCGGTVFFILVGASVVWNGLFAAGLRFYLKKLHDQVLRGEAIPEVVPFKWSVKTTIVFPIISVVAGAAASLLGIGGGLVLSFILLEAGLHPMEASATSAIATFLVASASGTQYAIQGNLRYDYGLLFVAAGALSTILGQKVFVAYIRRTGKNFLVAGALALIIGASILALAILGVDEIVMTIKKHGSFGFGTLCKH